LDLATDDGRMQDEPGGACLINGPVRHAGVHRAVEVPACPCDLLNCVEVGLEHTLGLPQRGAVRGGPGFCGAFGGVLYGSVVTSWLTSGFAASGKRAAYVQRGAALRVWPPR